MTGRKGINMRKLEFLRRAAKKITTEEQIYFLELPVEFDAKGAYKAARCIPCSGENGELVGIAVRSPFLCKNENGEYIATRTDVYKVPFPKIA